VVITPRRDNNRNARPQTYTPPTFPAGRYSYPSRPNYKPMHYGHWVFENRDPGVSRRSVYFHFGYFPYVEVSRVHVLPYISVGFRAGPVVIGGSYYLARQSTTILDDTLSDIRQAWTDGRLDLITNHTRTGQSIAVLLDGRYDYSLDLDDYIAMTSDAIDQMQTISFTWESVRERADGGYTAFGKHVDRDQAGLQQTVYVSYTLRGIAGQYVIEEVGSSTSPLM
jgi:hypothetical protein